MPDGSTLIIEKQNFDEFMHLYRKISEIKILEMSQELKAKDKTIFAKDQTIFAKDQTIFAKDQTILLLQEEKYNTYHIPELKIIIKGKKMK